MTVRFRRKRVDGDDGRVAPGNTTYGTNSSSARTDPDRRPRRNKDAALAQVDVYERQRAELERAFGSDPDSPWVSQIRAFERTDGTTFTMTTWGQDVPTLLPCADVISLAEIEDETVRTGQYVWDDVARHVGDMCWLVRNDLRPPRIFAHTWPPADVFEQLRVHALNETVHPHPAQDPSSAAMQRIDERAKEHRGYPT